MKVFKETDGNRKLLGYACILQSLLSIEMESWLFYTLAACEALCLILFSVFLVKSRFKSLFDGGRIWLAVDLLICAAVYHTQANMRMALLCLALSGLFIALRMIPVVRDRLSTRH